MRRPAARRIAAPLAPLLLASVAGFLIWREADFRRRAIATTALVESRFLGYRGYGAAAEAVYHVEGRLVRATVRSLAVPPRVGDRVAILYAPDDPYEARLAGRGPIVAGFDVGGYLPALVILTILAAAVAGKFARWSWRRKIDRAFPVPEYQESIGEMDRRIGRGSGMVTRPNPDRARKPS